MLASPHPPPIPPINPSLDPIHHTTTPPPHNSSAKPKAGAAASSSGGSAAAFNPAAIFAPTMKPSGGAKAAKGGGAGKSKDMGLDSLDALLRNAKKREKEVEAVKRNAYQGFGEEAREEEVEDGELEALEALVKGVSFSPWVGGWCIGWSGVVCLWGGMVGGEELWRLTLSWLTF